MTEVIYLFWFSEVHGGGTGKAPSGIPLQDKHLALAILLELAVQRGTLRYTPLITSLHSRILS